MPAIRVLLVAFGIAAFGAGILMFGLFRSGESRVPPADSLAKPAGNAGRSTEEAGVSQAQEPSRQPAADNQTQDRGSASAQGAAQGAAQGSAQGSVKVDRQRTQAPTFDVVRVEPDGESVVAGRAEPGSAVELLRDGILHDRIAADSSGLFAMTPPKLPAGDYQLTLRYTASDGRQAVSKQSVSVSIAPQKKEEVIVALSAPDRPTLVLSAPDRSGGKAQQGTRSLSTALSIESAEAGEGGKLYVSGRAASGAPVRLYLNDSYLASASPAQDGRFSFTIGSGVVPGDYRIRLDQVDAVSGAVRSRAEVPFNLPDARAAASPARNASPARQSGGSDKTEASSRSADGSSMVVVPEVKTATVSHGDSLWRISHRIYGEGLRYTVIYSANQQQIRNPDLIFPGQTFVLPVETR